MTKDASPRESTVRTDDVLQHAHALAVAAWATEPAGLLTDFDGTLSPIVPDPTSARLVEGAPAALSRLAERLAVVAVVTGRAPLDARRMTGVPGLLIAGNHGTEWLEPGSDEPVASPEAAAARAGVREVLTRLPELPGVTVEDKGSTASVHFRNSPDPDSALPAILAALGDVEPLGLRIGHGRQIVELRAIGLGDKGTATRAIVERFGLRGVVVMGDDVTDLDMFAAIDELRAAGRLRGMIVGVGGRDHEVPNEVVDASDVVLPGPAEAAAFLDNLSRLSE